jgi:hypothetical protein
MCNTLSAFWLWPDVKYHGINTTSLKTHEELRGFCTKFYQYQATLINGQNTGEHNPLYEMTYDI